MRLAIVDFPFQKKSPRLTTNHQIHRQHSDSKIQLITLTKTTPSYQAHNNTHKKHGDDPNNSRQTPYRVGC